MQPRRVSSGFPFDGEKSGDDPMVVMLGTCAGYFNFKKIQFVALAFCEEISYVKGSNNIDFFVKQKYPAHVPNITTLHHAQFGEYGSPSTMVTIGGAESAPPPMGKRTF